MKQNQKDRTLLNVLSTVVLQAITLLSGFVIPHLILNAFGSQVNGLVTSITQFLNYISLLEGGVSAVILANLYKPLVEKDEKKLSAIVVAANSFFQKLALVFLAYQIILALVYPFFLKEDMGWGYVASLTLILGIATFIQYYFALTWRLLLQADKKMFISSFVQGAAVVLNMLASIVLIKLWPEIHLVKFAAGIVYLLQPLILNHYIGKNYRLDMTEQPDPAVLAQRWDGFGINIAAMIHSSTATVVLTIMTGLNSVSVFSVYFLVVSGLKNLITSISAGLVPTLGNLYAMEDTERFDKLFDLYDMIMFFVSFLCFTVGALSVVPFALWYTTGITDANYEQPLLGALLMAAEGIFCLREPYVNMAYTARRFKKVSIYAYIEAALCIVLSVAFTWMWGSIGVAAALVVSISYRTLAQVVYIRRHVIHRSYVPFVKKLLGYTIAIAVGSMICISFISIQNITLLSWIVYAVKITIVIGLCLALASVVVCKKELRDIMSFVRRNEIQ